MNKNLFLFIGLFIFTLESSASSPEAWDEYRRQLLDSCISKAERIMHPTQIMSDDFGTESYGVVVLKGTRQGDGRFGYRICIRDKKTGDTEVTEFIEEM